MKAQVVIGLFLLLFGGVLLNVSGAFAAPTTITVNTTNDELNTDGDCSLREAVRAANLDTAVSGCPAGNGADTIVLQAAATYTLSLAGQNEDAAATGDLDLTKDVTINGNNAIVEAGTTAANGIDRVFQILPTSKATISNLRVRHGREANYAGILVQGALVLADSTVSLNTATGAGSGGGIGVLGNSAKLQMNNSVVSDNDAPLSGGGILSTGTLELNSSSISNNNAGTDGGGIFSSGTVTINNSTINGNTTNSAQPTRVGGGIYNQGDLTLQESTVIGNNSPDSGGIRNHGGTMTIVQSSILDNTAVSAAAIRNQNSGTLTIINSTISGNSTNPGSAGGIANSSGTVNLANVTIANNTAASGNGGGINNAATLNLKNSIVANNSASAGPDCFGTIQSSGFNLIESVSACTIVGTITGNKIGQDPLLAALALNGGTIKSHALNNGSPAIDKGNASGCKDHNNATLATDQRGSPRSTDGDGNGSARCDMGAYEAPTFVAPTATPTVTPSPTATFTPVPGCPTVPDAPILTAPPHKAIMATHRPKLNWQDMPCAQTYHVQLFRRKIDGVLVQEVQGVTVSEFRTQKLKAGKTYAWQVRACNKHGCSAFSTLRKFSTQS